jgi:hypothetical protein
LASDLTPSISSSEEAAGRMFFNLLEQNKRMEDIVTGLVSTNVALVSQNTALQSELQIISNANEQDSEEDVAEQDFEEDHYDGQKKKKLMGQCTPSGILWSTNCTILESKMGIVDSKRL